MTDFEPLINELKDKGLFLEKSRQNPGTFDSPMQFTLADNTVVKIVAPGIIVFEPDCVTHKDIVYSCGIHGNETAPIEICDELVQQILTGKLTLKHRLLVIFGNLPAMDIAQRFVEENLNRLFDGAHSEANVPTNPERQRAALLEQAVTDFFTDLSLIGQRERYHYDLHTAIRDSKNEKFAVYPFTHGRPRKPEQLSFLGACGVNTFLLSESPTTTFSYFSVKHFEADAFTVELGKVRPFGQNDTSRFAATKQVLTEFVSQPDIDLPDYNESDFLIYRVNQVVNKKTEEFSLCFDDATPNFMDYAKGTVLAIDGDEEICCQFEGEAIVFPNAEVEVGQRALLTVVPASLND